MTSLDHIGLVDLLVAGFVVLGVVGALRARSGLLGTVGTVIGSLVVAWIVTTALVVWGPNGVSDTVRRSTFAETFPAPTRALAQLGLTDSGPAGPDETTGAPAGLR